MIVYYPQFASSVSTCAGFNAISVNFSNKSQYLFPLQTKIVLGIQVNNHVHNCPRCENGEIVALFSVKCQPSFDPDRKLIVGPSSSDPEPWLKC